MMLAMGLKLRSGALLVALAVPWWSGCVSTPPKELRARAKTAYDQKQYAECARLYAEADQAGGGQGQGAGSIYDAACCQSLAGDRDAAFRSLRRAVDLGFKDASHLQKDSDLEPLHDDPRWAEVVSQAQAKQAVYLKTLNAELYQLYQEDQGDRSAGDSRKIDWTQVNVRDAARRDRVRQILEAGGATVSDDYFHAAMVFQHGPEAADAQRAHQLSLKAAELDPENKRARWLAAAAKDRELMRLGKPQLYGTQYVLEKDRWVLYPVDPSITDAEREKWNVPALDEAKKQAERLNARK